eukprot:9477927-Pyramimonas_sp.AAC.1
MFFWAVLPARPLQFGKDPSCGCFASGCHARLLSSERWRLALAGERPQVSRAVAEMPSPPARFSPLLQQTHHLKECQRGGAQNSELGRIQLARRTSPIKFGPGPANTDRGPATHQKIWIFPGKREN